MRVLRLAIGCNCVPTCAAVEPTEYSAREYKSMKRNWRQLKSHSVSRGAPSPTTQHGLGHRQDAGDRDVASNANNDASSGLFLLRCLLLEPVVVLSICAYGEIKSDV